MLKKLLTSITITITFIYGLITKEKIQIQIREINQKVSQLYRGEYKRKNVLPDRIFYLSQYCNSIVKGNEEFVVLEFNSESEAEILRYHLYPQHIVYIVNRVNYFNKLDPFIKSRNNVVNNINSFSKLIQFMKSKNIRFLIIPDTKNKIYSFVTENRKYFKPVGYEFGWGFYLLN